MITWLLNIMDLIIHPRTSLGSKFFFLKSFSSLEPLNISSSKLFPEVILAILSKYVTQLPPINKLPIMAREKCQPAAAET